MGIVTVVRQHSEWDETYIGAAQALQQGKDIYRAVPTDTYPPFSAWFFVPFTHLPLRLARGIWWAICAVSLVTLVKMAWRLAGGPQMEPIGGRPATSLREHAAFLIGHAIALQFTLNALTHCQTDLPIAALVMIGCAALAQERFYRGAIWIGLGAAFKATPLLFAPYLLLRRQWGAAIVLVAVMVGCNLLPDTVHRPDRYIWLIRWTSHYVSPMAKSDYIPGDWKNNLNNNQSLAGAAGRWLNSSPKEDSEALRSVRRPGAAPTPIVRGLLGGLCIAVMVPVAWAWRRRQARATPEYSAPAAEGTVRAETANLPAVSSNAPAQVNPHMIECGIVLLLMVLFSPNSSRAHFCVLYLAAFCVARMAVRPGASSSLRILLAIAVLCATLTIHLRLPFTRGIEQLLLWIGIVMLSTIFLLLASCLGLAGSPPAKRL